MAKNPRVRWWRRGRYCRMVPGVKNSRQWTWILPGVLCFLRQIADEMIQADHENFESFTWTCMIARWHLTLALLKYAADRVLNLPKLLNPLNEMRYPRLLRVWLDRNVIKTPDSRRGRHILPFPFCHRGQDGKTSMSEKVCAGDGSVRGQDVEVEERERVLGLPA